MIELERILEQMAHLAAVGVTGMAMGMAAAELLRYLAGRIRLRSPSALLPASAPRLLEPPLGYALVLSDRIWPAAAGPNPFQPCWKPGIAYLVLSHGIDRTVDVLAKAYRMPAPTLRQLLSWPTLDRTELTAGRATDTVN